MKRTVVHRHGGFFAFGKTGAKEYVIGMNEFKNGRKDCDFRCATKEKQSENLKFFDKISKMTKKSR